MSGECQWQGELGSLDELKRRLTAAANHANSLWDQRGQAHRRFLQLDDAWLKAINEARSLGIEIAWRKKERAA